MKQITLSNDDYFAMATYILLAKRNYSERAGSCTIPTIKKHLEESVKECENLLDTIKINTREV